MSMLGEIFGPEREPTILTLCRDEECRGHVLRAMGPSIMARTEVVSDLPFETVASTVSMARFAASDSECTDIAGIICRTMKRTDILPLLSCHRGVPLAERCLVSLSFFRKALDHRWMFHGAPRAEFYRQVGIQVFMNNDMGAIASHFASWEAFLGEVFEAG